MVSDYFPLLIQIFVAIAFAGGALVAPLILGKKIKHTQAKDMPYECGMNPISPSNPRFSVKFYLVAMLFIVFDIEIVFLYPWALVFKEMTTEMWSVLGAMLLFQGVLFVGFLYELKKGALDWKR
ncbi:MAG: NADH-quinone oxidoreductase subunit A [Verrucomicrobiia bacterium]